MNCLTMRSARSSWTIYSPSCKREVSKKMFFCLSTMAAKKLSSLYRYFFMSLLSFWPLKIWRSSCQQSILSSGEKKVYFSLPLVSVCEAAFRINFPREENKLWDQRSHNISRYTCTFFVVRNNILTMSVRASTPPSLPCHAHSAPDKSPFSHHLPPHNSALPIAN